MMGSTVSRRVRGAGRRGLLIVGGALALLAIGGVAWATIPDVGTAEIHGCYNKSTGALRVIDPSKSQTCATGETALNWGGAGLHWRGGWNATNAYAINDTVAFNGTLYVAKAASTASQPPSASWAAIADKPYANVFSESNESNPGTFPVLISSNLTQVATTSALPAGNFTITGQVTVFMDNGAQDLQCSLLDNHGNSLNGYAETSGPADSSNTGTVQTLSLVDAVANQASGTRILIKCAKGDGADPNTSEAVAASLAVSQTGTTVLNGTRFGSQ
jgi:hypothetical protein